MEISDTNIFPKGEKASADYFSGGTAWVHFIKPDADELNCQIAHVTIEPGCRNNWHSHGGGQILIVTSGTGFYQEKGKPGQDRKMSLSTSPLTRIPKTVSYNG